MAAHNGPIRKKLAVLSTRAAAERLREKLLAWRACAAMTVVLASSTVMCMDNRYQLRPLLAWQRYVVWKQQDRKHCILAAQHWRQGCCSRVSWSLWEELRWE